MNLPSTKDVKGIESCNVTVVVTLSLSGSTGKGSEYSNTLPASTVRAESAEEYVGGPRDERN